MAEFHPKRGVKSVRGMYQMLRLSAFLRRERFDVLHTTDLWTNLLGVPAGWLARVPVIVSSRRDLSHDPWYTPRNRAVLAQIQRLSTTILVNSQLVRDDLLRRDGFPPEKIRVVHNGIDLERFAVRADRERHFPGAAGKKLIVQVGNMHSEVKGHPWLIGAAVEVVRRFPEACFLLLGDGEMRPEFERLARDAGIGPRVLFLGHRGDVAEILSCCDIALSCSTAEGFPNAVLEYLAAGLPVVATAVGGSVEIIRDGQTGLLVAPRDEQALAAAMVRLLEDERLARSLGNAGRQLAGNFSVQRMVESTTSLYAELLSSQRRH